MKKQLVMGYRQVYLNATIAVVGQEPCSYEIIRTDPDSAECSVIVEKPGEGVSRHFANIADAFEFLARTIYFSKNDIPVSVNCHG